MLLFGSVQSDHIGRNIGVCYAAISKSTMKLRNKISHSIKHSFNKVASSHVQLQELYIKSSVQTPPLATWRVGVWVRVYTRQMYYAHASV